MATNATTYTVTGLSASSQYSFRLCAQNSDGSSVSSGITTTVTTLANGATTSVTPGSNQLLFSTAAGYTGNIGGIYFADFICQQEAVTASLPGIWKAVIGDESVSAVGRLTIGSAIYNMRPYTSGGIQQLSNGNAFWSGPLSQNANYTASGSTPSVVRNWTGVTSTGAINTGNTCTNWTTASSGTNGAAGYSTSPGSGMNITNNTCNNTNSIYCINQQSSSAAPSDPTGFVNSLIGPTSATFAWSSGGGTTAGYKISYQTGASAPANCATGTVIPASTIGINPSSYTISGLTASTQYSFRLCAVNSDESSASTGVTATVTTLATGSPVSNPGTIQQIFATNSAYYGNFGGIYFADYICQTDALNAGITGVWKAVLADETTTASSRISLSSAIYNSRPNSSGGIQIVNNGTTFWAGPWSNNTNYTAAGGTPPTTRNWVGITNNGGINTGNTCNSWTTLSSANNALVSYTTTPNNGVFNNYVGCNNQSGFFCINQQTASSAPPDPTGFTNYLIANDSLGFNWASGGGTTAAYKIAYQTGGTAPADCNSGTVISDTLLGVNPTNYTVTGLAASTQYSFRLCAYNSDLSLASAGVTVTATTSGSGTSYSLGSMQVIFSTTSTYLGNFGGIYYADYACQTEAVNAGLSGTWKAVIGDESTSAASRLTLNTNIYNARPISAGGFQKIYTGSGFWGGPLSYNLNYSASGGSPGVVRNWTGVTNTGAINAGNTCTSWTANVTNINGTAGYSTTPSNGMFNANNRCNST
jgi:uncharacterized protein YegP (UPF0339 family)